jgi:hypothetical protein
MGREVMSKNGKFAVRETVTDTDIITPWFSTEEELIEHLVNHGDDWDSGPIDRKNAEAFVRRVKFVPSAALIGGRFLKTYELAE